MKNGISNKKNIFLPHSESKFLIDDEGGFLFSSLFWPKNTNGKRVETENEKIPGNDRKIEKKRERKGGEWKKVKMCVLMWMTVIWYMIPLPLSPFLYLHRSWRERKSITFSERERERHHLVWWKQSLIWKETVWHSFSRRVFYDWEQPFTGTLSLLSPLFLP